MSEVVATAAEDALCPVCGTVGEYGYRDKSGVLRWFCAEHRLRKFSADAQMPVPVESRDVIEAAPQQSLEDPLCYARSACTGRHGLCYK